MALIKNIKMDNGVPMSYHRIAMIKVDINQQVTLLVESYVDEEGRLYEKDYAKGLIVGEPAFPYTYSNYIPLSWEESIPLLTGDLMQNAYDWLKENSIYSGSEDI